MLFSILSLYLCAFFSYSLSYSHSVISSSLLFYHVFLHGIRALILFAQRFYVYVVDFFLFSILRMDSTKSLVLPIILKGDNYLLWSRTTKIALCSRGLWSHITDIQAPPSDNLVDGTVVHSPDGNKWFQDDQMVMAILQNSLEHSILAAYSFCETAKELWDTLKNVFGNISNLSRIFEVKKTLNGLQQEEKSFTQHFGEYRALWAELETLRPPTLDPAVLSERREQDQVFGLLLTLKPSFNGLIRHILRSDKLPSLNEVCMQIQKEEGSFGLFNQRNDLAMANKGVYKRDDKKTWVCDHCKKKGHTKEKCWVLHPHLKPSKFKEDKKALISSIDPMNEKRAMSSTVIEDDVVRRSELESLIKTITSLKESGKALTSFKNSKPIIIDSGASHHMISDSNLLDNIKPTCGDVIIANGDKIPVKGLGNLKLFNQNSQAFYIPKFTSNLLSVKKATSDLDCVAIFGPNEVYFQDTKTGNKLGEGVVKDGLYLLESSKSSSNFNIIANNAIWHARLGHPHTRALGLLIPNVSFNHETCEACILGKHCKSVFPKSSTIYESCFDLIHSDVWTAPCASRDQNKYFVTFIDEKSKYTWITLLSSKSRVLEAFTNFYNYVFNQFNKKVKILRTDNGGEYISHEFKNFLVKHGIVHQTSCPYTPQQNGVAERKNRHLMEVARSMMFHKNVPKIFWGDAVMTACYLINRIPTKCLNDISPFEVLNNLKPSIEHLKVFGCVCFVYVSDGLRNKLQPKSTKCMFIGYSSTQKGYKCYEPETKRTFVSRNVKFIEEKGYYEERDWEKLKDLSHSQSDKASSLQFLLDHLSPRQETNKGNDDYHSSGVSSDIPPRENSTTNENIHHDSEETSKDHDDAAIVNEEDEFGEQSFENNDEHPTPEEQPMSNEVSNDGAENPIPLRRSTRIRKDPSNWINTRVYYNNKAIAHPIQKVCSLAHLPTNHKVFLSKIDQDMVPQTYEEAKGIKEWMDAIEDEIGAMKRNNTWEVRDLPKGKKTVGSRWVFTIKYLSNGEIERYKARLVAKGFTQTFGVDYKDTFAPVAKLHTVRVILSLATNLSWELWQMDVKNAFLQGELEDEVYMLPPPGLKDSIEPGKVLKLRKAIYGLKQSPRAWYHKLSTTLRNQGFRRSETDHSLFTIHGKKGSIVVLIYVDDIIITGSDCDGIQDTKSFLKTAFDIKDLGELKYFLGIEVCRSKEGLFLSQRKYTLDLLSETGKIGAKPAKTPIEEGYQDIRKGELDEDLFEDIGQYQRLVGKLIYLTITRPDISFAVNQVSQHMHAPKIHNWKMIERILRYLKGAPGKGIWMGKNDHTEITGYCDADWAGDKMDRKSTTGYCTFIGGNLVTWKSKKQKVVSRSSAEAEYRAMASLTDELIWLKALLKDLGVESSKPITMHCDNQAAIHIASNSVFHERTKHIEVDCHHIREKVEMGIIIPTYTRSSDQLADVFTKATNSKICNHIHSKLGLVNLHQP